MDNDGNDLAIPVSSVIRNPLYFGQKDLAYTAPGYEFELLHKLVGGRVSTKDSAIAEQVATLAEKIRLLNSVTEIHEQIKELEENARDIEHKLTVFKEKGISEKLEKQTACNADGVKVEDIIKEAKRISQLLTNFLCSTHQRFLFWVTSKLTKPYLLSCNHL